jgi:Na+-driven multidrug efflux pump
VRLVFSYLFAVMLDLGVMGIAWAMCLDWTVRGIFNLARLKNGKWKRFKII